MSTVPSPTTSTGSPKPARAPIDSREPVVIGDPIDTASLTGRILLSSEDDVFTANADGSGLVRVTEATGPEFDAAWSPDGSRIVYRDSRRGINEDDEIFVVNADGTGLSRVTPEFGQFMAWSPDGRMLLVSGYDLYVIRPDGTGRASLAVAGLTGGLFPDWIA